ncbi:16079_t:CDS:1, partial [Entrophospora sp. SA101]
MAIGERMGRSARQIKKDPNAFVVESSGDESDEELPFACLICRNEFKNPVVT